MVSNFAPENQMVDDTFKTRLHSLISDFLTTRDSRRQADKISKAMKAQEDILELQLITLLDGIGLKNIKLDDGTLISSSSRSNPYVINFQEFREWCNETGNFDLLREEVSRQRLRDYISSELKGGNPDAIPPGINYQVERIIHVKGRPSESEESGE